MSILGNSGTPSGGDGANDSGALITSSNVASPGGTVLSSSGVIQSLSIYVISGAAGNVLLGLYDNSGAAGQAGSLKASCPSTAIVNGWNIIPVSTQVLLPAGTYWFAFTANSNLPNFGNQAATTYTLYALGQPYSMPATAPTFSNSTLQQYGMYGTIVDVLLQAQILL